MGYHMSMANDRPGRLTLSALGSGRLIREARRLGGLTQGDLARRLGATLHGSSALTNDADVCPDPSPENRERLAAALRDIRARVRTEAEPDGVRFAVDADFLRRTQLVNLTTRYGDFDIAFQPAGSRGYEDLVGDAIELEIDGTVVRVASLADIIRSKELANVRK